MNTQENKFKIGDTILFNYTVASDYEGTPIYEIVKKYGKVVNIFPDNKKCLEVAILHENCHIRVNPKNVIQILPPGVVPMTEEENFDYLVGKISRHGYDNFKKLASVGKNLVLNDLRNVLETLEGETYKIF